MARERRDTGLIATVGGLGAELISDKAAALPACSFVTCAPACTDCDELRAIGKSMRALALMFLFHSMASVGHFVAQSFVAPDGRALWSRLFSVKQPWETTRALFQLVAHHVPPATGTPAPAPHLESAQLSVCEQMRSETGLTRYFCTAPVGTWTLHYVGLPLVK